MSSRHAGLGELEVLARDVDAVWAATRSRRGSDMRCGRGCDACCRVELEVCPAEAERLQRHLAILPRAGRDRIVARAESGSPHRCVMLEDDGSCAVYDARPLVCRTQGLPLRYPAGYVPVEAVMGRMGADAVIWCPLNFVKRGPDAPDVLEAGRGDLRLALANESFCEATGADPASRLSLRDLAREAGGDENRHG